MTSLRITCDLHPVAVSMNSSSPAHSGAAAAAAAAPPSPARFAPLPSDAPATKGTTTEQVFTRDTQTTVSKDPNISLVSVLLKVI